MSVQKRLGRGSSSSSRISSRRSRRPRAGSCAKAWQKGGERPFDLRRPGLTRDRTVKATFAGDHRSFGVVVRGVWGESSISARLLFRRPSWGAGGGGEGGNPAAISPSANVGSGSPA